MQWAPPLLLLLGAVAVESLTCHNRFRRATTLNGLQSTSWRGSGDAGEKQDTCQGNWTACARWLTNFGNEWEDHYDGCNNEGKAKHYETTQLVQKYCADRSDTSCTSTQFFTWDSLEHKPTHLCCCFDDLCNATFAMQQALTTSTQKPPSGLKQHFTCEASMRNATTPAGLRRATAMYNHNERCEATWAPCVEFVYKNEADGLWRQWGAGCSYKYGSVNYADIVEQFCTASYECQQFDMIEPSTRVIGDHGTFVYTQAYACCCNGTGCDMPDTVGISQAAAQTAPPPSTTTAGQATAASTGDGGVDDGGSLLWLWLLLGVVVLLLAIAAAVAAVVVWRRQKAAEKRKERRAIQAKTMAPMLPFTAACYMQDSEMTTTDGATDVASAFKTASNN